MNSDTPRVSPVVTLKFSAAGETHCYTNPSLEYKLIGTLYEFIEWNINDASDNFLVVHDNALGVLLKRIMHEAVWGDMGLETIYKM